MPGVRSSRPDGNQTGHDASAVHSEDPSLARIGAFSDGVFAFAITLLILAIRIPHPTDADANNGLLTLLRSEVADRPAQTPTGSRTRITVIRPSTHSRRMMRSLPMNVLMFMRSRTIASS